jgi:hypothetical protein
MVVRPLGHAMKNTSTKNCLIDSLIVGCLTCVAVFVLPLVSAWFVTISLHLGRTLFWVHSIALSDLLPHAIIGCLLGLVTALLVRHRKLSVALLPAVLICIFYVFYLSFGSDPYHWGQSWHDFVLVGSWLLLIVVSLFCARFVFQRRAA